MKTEPCTKGRRVVSAALAYKNLLILGPRHFDATMHKQIDQSRCAGLVAGRSWEEGFVDQYGVFMTREEAWIVAEAAGQIIRRVGGDGIKLYSENLY